MHSIVVLGDVRNHVVRIQYTSELKTRDLGSGGPILAKTIRGGAYLVTEAVRQIVEQRNIGRNRNGALLNVFSLKAPPPGADETLVGEYWEWTLARKQLAGATKESLRLTKGVRGQRVTLIHPACDLELCQILADEHGKFEHGSYLSDAQLEECPDIVLLDDLDVWLRRTAFSVNDQAELSSARNRLREYQPSLTDPKFQDTNRDCLTDVLATLFERLTRAEMRANEKLIPLLEPVIIGSIKNRPEDAFTVEGTIWNRLLHNPWLSERTVLLLDVDDLRKSGLAISTGLSWERTAQDAISQLRHSRELRPYLQFGHLIIRFGVTGALHVSRTSYTTWTYNLHFDPMQDDAIWTDADQDGVIQGYTAVYTACIVRELLNECSDTKGHPFRDQLAPAISRGLSDAISRCRYLAGVGYGEGDLEKAVTNLEDGKYLPDDLFSRPQADPTSVVSAQIPPTLLRNWSILSQSALQARMGSIATDIVLYGADRVLNQPSFSFKELRVRLAERIIARAKELLPTLSQSGNSLAWYLVFTRASEDLRNDKHLLGTLADGQYERIVPIGELTQQSDRWKALIPTSIEDQTKLETHFLGSACDAAFDDLLGRVLARETPEDPLVTPIVQFGKKEEPLFVVDRREVEGFRAIERLMKKHFQEVRDERNKRPLCIAIFGPPGSGKSFAVKKINDSLNHQNSQILSPFNLGEFTDVEDLENAFSEISNAGAGKVVPIVFFDEFDSQFESHPLGWLKFFLAPMEDGKFKGKSVRNAILVFAGGTSYTFREFSLANRSISDPQWIKFSDAKGPDFASRLSGHLDIVGVNTAGADDELFLIRRALLLRSMLSEMQGLRSGYTARIDTRMLSALLNSPEYRHGGRSMRKLLELCTANDGSISPSAVPPIHQLNMHVDGKAFLDLLAVAT